MVAYLNGLVSLGKPSVDKALSNADLVEAVVKMHILVDDCPTSLSKMKDETCEEKLTQHGNKKLLICKDV
jgi:ribulose-5-phosphate 4-epimerase/fuculose-1-phosphate aldolase